MPPVQPDPFLAAHQLEPFVFDICWGLAPVSIRDQMLRGTVLAQRLSELDVVNGENPLLVVGAGVAGVTIALQAALREIPTFLVEALDQPFALQARCQTRYLHPCQYDWPLPHWESSTAPPVGEPPWIKPPLSYQADSSAALARTWRQEFATARAVLAEEFGDKHLQVFYGVKVKLEEPGKEDTLPKVSFLASEGVSRPDRNSFGAVVCAAGFGTERVALKPRGSEPMFRSVAFWETDSLEQLSAYKAPRVVVVGAGDGALQDFLRVVSGRRSAREVFGWLLDGGATRKALPGLQQTLHAAEDQAQRAASWVARSSHEDHAIQSRLHEAHEEEVLRLLADPAIKAEVEVRFDSLIKPATFSQVTLVHSCHHFPQAYALNRFLVCLLLELARQTGREGLISVLPDTGVRSVACTPTCAFSWHHSRCYGHTHHVELEAGSCPLEKKKKSAPPVTRLDAEVIVMRLGIEGQDHPFKADPRAAQRQLLPYMVPF